MDILKALLKGFGITLGMGLIVAGAIILSIKLANMGAGVYFGAIGICFAFGLSAAFYYDNNG